MNAVEQGMLPVEVIGEMSHMYKNGETYEVMVEDRMNPGTKFFSFGLNGRVGEYPTNAKIRLKGEEIQHLYNCTYESPVVEDAPGDFRRVVGKRVVCRFSITPTMWGALPPDGVLLGGGECARPAPEEAPFPGREDAPDGPAPRGDGGPSADELLAAREGELERMSVTSLREIASGLGLRQGGGKPDLVASILRREEEIMKGAVRES